MRCVAVMPRDAAPTLPAAQVGGSSMQMWLCLCHVCLCLFPYVCLCLCRGCLCQPQRVPLPLQIATQALRAFAGMACFPSARQELAESQQLVAGEWVDGWLGVVSCWMDGLCEWVVVVGFNAGLRPLPCKDPRPTRPLCCCCRRRVMCARARCAIFCPQRVPWVPYPCPPLRCCRHCAVLQLGARPRGGGRRPAMHHPDVPGRGPAGGVCGSGLGCVLGWVGYLLLDQVRVALGCVCGWGVGRGVDGGGMPVDQWLCPVLHRSVARCCCRHP